MYRGEEASSEPEVQNIVNFLLPQARAFIAYISYHSYGQRFFTRWDFTGKEVPEDHEELVRTEALPRNVDAFCPE